MRVDRCMRTDSVHAGWHRPQPQPAPGALALFGLSGLLATRRRRA
ncbi:MAG: hypothetical protein EA376_07620 [Phycisphaeraceae bacterium]|nr:MAG: hypothetical protein EA376_07620 [Phycisphaeraceae bacterium]